MRLSELITANPGKNEFFGVVKTPSGEKVIIGSIIIQDGKPFLRHYNDPNLIGPDPDAYK
jgi:hypothetical protein